MKKSFREWMKEVNSEVEKRVGLGVDDLPDCPFSQWYEDGKTAKAAAAKAIKNA